MELLHKSERAYVMLAILIVLAGFYLFLKPIITGNVIISQDMEFTDRIDERFTVSSRYLWIPNRTAPLQSIKISGYLQGEGTARVYLSHNNTHYLVFDSSRLKEGLAGLTGLVVYNESEELIPEEENISKEVIESSAVPLEKILSEVLNETPREVNITIGSPNLTEEQNAGEQENLVERIISIQLDYNSGTSYDANDDGVETREGVVDLSVKDTEFNWDVDTSKVCTRWEVYSEENKEATTLCYGATDCCNFISLAPGKERWDEPYYIYYGKDDATAHNVISAQVLYVDYNLTTLTSEIYSGNWQNLTTTFIEQQFFNEVCEETCLLAGLNESEYTLVIEVDAGVTLYLENISYIQKITQVLDIFPPGIVRNLHVANITPNGIVLAWTNPSTYDFTGVKVLRREIHYPDTNFTKALLDKDVADITAYLENSRAETITDSDVETNITYFYRMYSYDASGNYALGQGVFARFDITNISVRLTDELVERIEIGKPVKWIKKIQVEQIENISFELPDYALNVEVYKKIHEQKIRLDKKALKEQRQRGRLNISIEDNATAYEIAYETPAPEIHEISINEYTKQITVSSNIHYQNIFTYTDLPLEAPIQGIKLYQINNGTRELFSNVAYNDTNNNGLVDRISWIVSHLSNETFEVEITVLNVQSYPTIGGIWEVRFTTVGKANLTIRAFNGTTWSDANTYSDLKFLEARCGGAVQDYSWINSSVVIENYSCNETGYETSKVITPGKHHLEFDFGGIKAYAHNLASGWLAQNGEAVMSGTTTPVDIPIAVNTSKAFILLSRRATGTYDDPNYAGVYVAWVNSTRFNLYQFTSGGTFIIWQVIEGASISVQSDIQSYNRTQTSFDIPINSVNTSRTVVFMSFGSCNQTSAVALVNQTFWAGNVSSSTNLHLERSANGTCSGNVSYFVTEFNDGSIIQSGEISNVGATATPSYAYVNPINMSNTWFYFSQACNAAAGGLDDTSIRASYYNTTAFVLSRRVAGGTARAQWYAISTPGAIVQNGTQNYTGTGGGSNIALSTINLNRSFSIHSFDNAGTATTYANAYWTSQLKNSTHLNLTRAGIANIANVSWQVIQLPAPTPDNPPTVTLNNPQASYTNDTANPAAINFNCSVTDDINATNISLYITNSTNQSFSLNASCTINDVNGSCNWSISLSYGNYTWNCFGYDNSGQTDWDENRTILINYSSVPSNMQPNISWVESSSMTPNIGTNKTIYISFNATDTDGYQNLNNATAKINLTYQNEEPRASQNCSIVSSSGNTTQFNCSITIWYYDAPGLWQINASIYDINGAYAQNISQTYEIQSLTAVALNRSSMAFTAYLGQTMIPSSTNPLGIDNLGNVNITLMNITAFDLNKTGSNELITANSFMANITNNATIHGLANATKATILGAFVPRDMPLFAQNESVYFYVNISSSGLTAGTFSSMYEWVIDVS